MVMVDFNDEGNLPPGMHSTTWREFSERFGFNYYRKKILHGMRRALINLKLCGCKTVYIDGSFTTDKYKPNDFDGCWELDSVDLEQLDPILQDFSNGRKAQKGKYGGELFPASSYTGTQTYLKFFQQDKESGNSKGIACINLEEFQ